MTVKKCKNYVILSDSEKSLTNDINPHLEIKNFGPPARGGHVYARYPEQSEGTTYVDTLPTHAKETSTTDEGAVANSSCPPLVGDRNLRFRGGQLFGRDSSQITFAQNDCRKKKLAFTLAEVLITLGIIGVVAAMTIPNLMTQIQWIVLKQQYKEAYSTLNQALRLVYEKTDTIFECYYVEDGNSIKQGSYDNSECQSLYNELSQVLKVSQVCEGNAYANGCIPKYNGLDNVYANKYPDKDPEEETKGCDGFHQKNILNRNVAWVLHDGTIIGFYGPKSDIWTKIFFVDINGSKGPNKWGYDLFTFRIMSDNSGTKSYVDYVGGCILIEKGGKTGKQMMK